METIEMAIETIIANCSNPNCRSWTNCEHANKTLLCPHCNNICCHRCFVQDREGDGSTFICFSCGKKLAFPRD